MEWYYADSNNEQKGPHSEKDLVTLFMQKNIDKETLVWNETLDGWTNIMKTELKSKLIPKKRKKTLPPPMKRGPPKIMAKKVAKKKVQDNGGEKKRRKTRVVQGATFGKKTNSDWKEYKTQDGRPFYYNKKTKARTWKKPDELKNEDELELKGDWVWMPHEDEAYVPARLVERQRNGDTVVETKEGDQHTFSKKVTLLELDTNSLMQLERDLVMLDEMNKPLILYNLKHRFLKNEIYTYVGTILISINPYKRLPLYTPTVIDNYRHRGMKKLAPHVFVIADNALNNIIETERSQSIVISGESGAGKTEATKQCLQYLAEVSGSVNNVEQKILVANPILEAFGNAKTVRNNNSSRFGKYVEIFFNKKAEIAGARTTNYLLEKTRVVSQAEGERNYHVFYQLCGCDDEALKEKYRLGSAEDFDYLTGGGDLEVDGMDDSEEYEEMLKAMDKLDFDEKQRDSIFSLVAGILHLGNVNFTSKGERKCAVDDMETLNESGKLLGFDTTKFKTTLETKVLKMKGDDDITVFLSVAEAETIRDSLSKFIYEKLFDWLVKKINKSIGVGKGSRTIGILDIFGFEIFESNSFEQLCINYANEKLQQFFNAHTFKLEEQVYKREGIKFDHVTYIDNQPVLDLIEDRRKGILPSIDEEIRMPKGTDETWIKKLHKKHSADNRYESILKEPKNFVINHYAGRVVYDSFGFLIKSKDQLTDDALALISTSPNKFLKSLFPGLKKRAKKETLGGKFSKQLSALMTTLNKTEPHYIRCIKPNPDKSALHFVGRMVIEQLRYSGVFEAVEIRKKGYPFRRTHKEFFKRFRVVNSKGVYDNLKGACKGLVQSMNIPEGKVQHGKSMVLYQATEHQDMELARNVAVDDTILFLQTHIKRWLAQRLAAKLRKVKPVLIAAMKTRTIEAVEKALSTCGSLEFPMYEIKLCKELRLRLVEEKRVNQLLKDLVKLDAEEIFEQLSKAIAAADAVELKSPIAEQARKNLALVVIKRQVRKDLIQGVKDADEGTLKKALDKAKELGLKPIGGDLDGAKKMYDRIQAEKQVLNRLEEGCNNGGWFKEGDVADSSKLRKAIDVAKKFGVKTAKGKQLWELANILAPLRDVFNKVVGTKQKQLWKEAEKLVISAGEKFSEHPEIAACREEVSHQAAVDEIDARLKVAVQQLDQEQLQYGLKQADDLKMSETLYPIIPDAKDYLARIVHCRGLMEHAVEAVDEDSLIKAIEYANSFGFNTEEVNVTRKLRDEVIDCNLDADFANTVLEETLMKQVLQRADQIKLTSETIENIRKLLFNTSEEKFVQLQLKAAVKMSDPSRVTRVTIKLKDLFYQRSGAMFKLSNAPQLRSSLEWASLKLLSFNKDALRAGMLKHTKNPIHASLTTLPSKPSKEATKLFKNILGFMGDRHLSYANILAQEILQLCLEKKYLRDEIYCQIIKQVTKNPGPASKKKGWQLMAMCLETFPPNQQFENYLEMVLRTKSEPSKRYITLLHQTVYGGARKQPLSEDEMERVKQGKALRPTSFLDDEKKEVIRRPDDWVIKGRKKVKIEEKEEHAPEVEPEPEFDDSYQETYQEPDQEEVAEPEEKAEGDGEYEWHHAVHPDNGEVYYYNIRTFESTWNKPDDWDLHYSEG